MVNVFLKGKKILRCKNTGIAFIYDALVNYIDQSTIHLSANLENLMERFDTAGYGIDSDIASFLKNDNDRILILNILKKSLDAYLEKFQLLEEETKTNLINFYEQMAAYST